MISCVALSLSSTRSCTGNRAKSVQAELVHSTNTLLLLSSDWFQPTTLQPSACVFLFSHFVAARDALTTQHVAILRPGNETQQSTVFVVHSGTAGTNLTDSTFTFNSLISINMMWTLVSFDQKWPLEMSFSGRLVFVFDPLSTFQSLYFITFTGVNKFNQYFYFYQSIFKQVSVLLLEERMCRRLQLTSSFAAVIITTATRGCCPTKKSKDGL